MNAQRRVTIWAVWGDFLPGNLDDLVRYFLGGIQEWQGPSILDLLEFVPTVYGGGNVFNIQSLGTDWQLETENLGTWRYRRSHTSL